MFRLLQQQQAPPAPAGNPPVALPVTNLQKAADNMPDLDPAGITANMKAWFDLLHQDKPEDVAALLASGNQDMRQNGDPQKEGPQLALINTGGGNVEIVSCLTEVPQPGPNQPPVEPLASLPQASAFRQEKYIAVLGNRANSQDTWIVVPTSANLLFQKKKSKLGKWTSITAPAANSRAIVIPSSGNEIEFYPYLPLCGKAICTEVIEGLYPTLANGTKWTPKQLAHKLKPYIDGITDQQTRDRARNSLLSLVSRKGRAGNDTAGSIAVVQALNDPLNQPMEAWAVPVIEATLDPKVPANATAITTLQTTQTGGAQASNTANLNLQNTQTGGNVGVQNSQATQHGQPNTHNQHIGTQNSQATQQGQPNGITGTQNSQGIQSGQPSSTSTGVSQPNGITGTQNSQGIQLQSGQNSPGIQLQSGQPSSSANTGVSFQEPVQPTWQQQAQQQWEQTFTIGNSHRGAAAMPPTKQTKPNEDTGFDSLSTYKKRCAMTFSRAHTASGIKPALVRLLAVPSKDRYDHFMTEVMPQLRLKDEEAYAGFAYTAQFVEDLCNFRLTSHDPTENWWNGFVGNQLKRSKEEIQAINNLYFSRRDSTLNLQVNATQLHKLDTKSPVPIDEMTELKLFLRRTKTTGFHFFTEVEVSNIANNIYKGLLSQGRFLKLKLNPTWLATKPREIIYFLLQVEQAEFSHVLPEEDFLDGYTKDFYRYDSTPQLLANCFTPQRSVTDEELPNSLRPLPPLPPPNPNPRGRNNGNGGAGNPNNGNYRNPGNGNPRNPRQQLGQQQGQGQGPPRNNPRLHPLLRAFWNEVPPERQNEGLARWLRLAHSSTNQCLHDLGVPEPGDCGHYHLRGSCNRPYCNNPHAPSNPSQQAVEQVVQRLRQGMQQSA